MLRDVSQPERIYLTRRERQRLAYLGINPAAIRHRDDFLKRVGAAFNHAIETSDLGRAEELMALLESGQSG